MDYNKILNIIKTIIAIILGRISMLLGGFDLMLSTMVGFMSTDYILGVYAAKVNNEVNSKIGYRGIARKIFMLVPIGLAYSLDVLLKTDMLRNTAIVFYIANDGISILENLGKAGVKIPKKLRDALVQLNDEAERE